MTIKPAYTRLPTGLSGHEAEERLTRFGPNALPETKPIPLWWRFLRQFHSPTINYFQTETLPKWPRAFGVGKSFMVHLV